MKVTVSKSRNKRGRVKIYARVQRHPLGSDHACVRIRTKGMKRWLCDCANFLFEKAGKRRHCAHLRAAKLQAMKQFNMRWKSL